MNENVLKEEIAMLENQIRILQQENQELKKQLDYLRSGEYLNQLKFERNMLEDLVQEEKLSNEVYSIKKIMQANTRLAEKNQELEKQLEKTNTTLDTHNELIEYMKKQQKEFIDYLENEKDRLSRECSQIYEDSLGKTRLVNKDIFNEADKNLAKYKEIIGGKDERYNKLHTIKIL